MSILRRFASGLALFALMVLAGALMDAPARAGDITYPGLNTATTVQDTDLLATWRAAGPLTKVQASVLNAYIQGKLNPVYLQIGNALSELSTNAATARTNLGLGSAAQANTGTSGTALCQLNFNCTASGTWTFNAAVTMNGGVTVNGNSTVTGTETVGTENDTNLNVSTSAALPATATVGGKVPLTDYLAWQNYTPGTAPTPDGGSFSNVSYGLAQYMRINKTIWFQMQVHIAAAGNATGCLTVGMPVAAGTSTSVATSFENNQSLSGAGVITGSTVRVCSSTGNSPWSGNDNVNISGFYPANS